jgi:putative transposase
MITFIEPGAPWQNPWVESFNGRMRDECLEIKDFATLLEARVIIGDWRHAYNHDRPHSSLHYQAPAVYAATCIHQPQLS